VFAGYDHTYPIATAAFGAVTLALPVHGVSKPLHGRVHFAAAKALEDVSDWDAAF